MLKIFFPAVEAVLYALDVLDAPPVSKFGQEVLDDNTRMKEVKKAVEKGSAKGQSIVVKFD